MHEFYEQTRESALFALGAVVGHPVEDSHEAVHAALAEALKDHSCADAARAICAFTGWKWAHLEIKAHASIKA